MSRSSQEILGVSESVEAVRTYVPKVAASEAPVLVTGETGTGKERIAQNIHALSRRQSGPFVAVNCAALPPSLFESEFFGHERGAFTGAMNQRKGRAAAADGGTLFLDEVGDMDVLSQSKLLRFLESGQIERLGSNQQLHVDVRIVAATNEYLEDLIEERRFRADLYYRLNVARIELAPLRDRPEDIPVLLEHFIDEMNLRSGHRVGAPDTSLVDCLRAYDWPGNIRELRNLVEALFIDPPRGTLTLNHLPPSFKRRITDYSVHSPSERDAIVEALKRTDWNKSEAARQLKISRMSIYRKIAKYDLSDEGPVTE